MVAASTISKLIIVLLTVVVVMVVGNNLIHGPFLWVLNILHLPWGGSRAILTDEQAAKSVYEQFLENVAEFVNNDKAAQVFTVDVDTLSYPQDKVFFCIVGVHSSGKTTFSLKRSKSSEKDCIKSGNVIEKNISDKFNKYHYLFDMNSLFSSGGDHDLLYAFQHLPICLQSPMSTGPIYFTFPLSTAPNDDKEWILLVRNPLITYLDSSFKIYDYSELDNSNSNENSLKKSITLKYPCVADQHYLSISHDFRYVGYGLYAISKSAISESKVDSLLKVENNLKSIPYHTLLFSCFEQKSKEPSNCGFIEHSWGLDPFYLKYLLCDESNSQSELCSEIEQFIEGKHYKENGMNVTQANCLAPESGFICNTADLYYQSHDYMTCTDLEKYLANDANKVSAVVSTFLKEIKQNQGESVYFESIKHLISFSSILSVEANFNFPYFLRGTVPANSPELSTETKPLCSTNNNVDRNVNPYINQFMYQLIITPKSLSPITVFPYPKFGNFGFRPYDSLIPYLNDLRVYSLNKDNLKRATSLFVPDDYTYQRPPIQMTEKDMSLEFFTTYNLSETSNTKLLNGTREECMKNDKTLKLIDYTVPRTGTYWTAYKPAGWRLKDLSTGEKKSLLKVTALSNKSNQESTVCSIFNDSSCEALNSALMEARKNNPFAYRTCDEINQINKEINDSIKNNYNLVINYLKGNISSDDYVDVYNLDKLRQFCGDSTKYSKDKSLWQTYYTGNSVYLCFKEENNKLLAKAVAGKTKINNPCDDFDSKVNLLTGNKTAKTIVDTTAYPINLFGSFYNFFNNGKTTGIEIDPCQLSDGSDGNYPMLIVTKYSYLGSLAVKSQGGIRKTQLCLENYSANSRSKSLILVANQSKVITGPNAKNRFIYTLLEDQHSCASPSLIHLRNTYIYTQLYRSVTNARGDPDSRDFYGYRTCNYLREEEKEGLCNH